MNHKNLLKENLPETCKSHFTKEGDKNSWGKNVLQYMSKMIKYFYAI